MAAPVFPLALAHALEPSESARPVPNASRYWVTDEGRVLSLVKGLRVLQPARSPKGYFHVEVWRDADCDPDLPARWHPYVHELVALAHIGPRPTAPGVAYQIDHVNGDKTDNRRANLRYVTRAENLRLSIATGLNPSVKLSPVAVWEHRCLAYVDGDAAVVAHMVEEYGLGRQAIRDALAGRSWATVPDPAFWPTADELARALHIDDEAEVHRLLGLSPFSEEYVPQPARAASQALPFRSSVDPRAA